MRNSKNLTILSDAEQAALYELPDFDDEQRLEYLHKESGIWSVTKNYPEISGGYT